MIECWKSSVVETKNGGGRMMIGGGRMMIGGGRMMIGGGKKNSAARRI